MALDHHSTRFSGRLLKGYEARRRSRRREDGHPRALDELPLALSVRGVAVRLRIPPLGGGCSLRPVSLERLGVTIVSRGASVTRRGCAERSHRPLSHLVRLRSHAHFQSRHLGRCRLAADGVSWVLRADPASRTSASGPKATEAR
jgi:hypothetical protein